MAQEKLFELALAVKGHVDAGAGLRQPDGGLEPRLFIILALHVAFESPDMKISHQKIFQRSASSVGALIYSATLMDAVISGLHNWTVPYH